MERYNPLNDFLFRKAMGEAGDEEQLLGFLKSALQRTGRDDIGSLTITGETNLTAEIVGDKSSILDVLAVLSDGTRVTTEIQIRRVAGFDRRILQYWARDYARMLNAGKEYDIIPDEITIVIAEFSMVDLPEFHTSFHLREDEHPDCVLTNAMEIHVIDMTAFRQAENVDLANPLHRWLTFLDKDTPEKTVEEVIHMDQAIQRASERMNFVLQDKESLRMYQMREMAMSEWASGVKLAHSEGRAEEKIETAKKAIRRGLDTDLIVDLTGLDAKRINKLRTELQN